MYYLQSLPFLYSGLSKDRYSWDSLIDFGKRYIISDHHEDENYSKICSKEMNKSIRSYMLRIVIMFTTFTIGYTKMNYATIALGIKTTSVEVKIPLTKEKSNYEFGMNYVLQTIIAAYGFFGYICMETAMELIMLAVASSPKLIKFEFQKMDTKIEKGLLNPLQVLFTFRNIVQQVMDVDRYECILITINLFIDFIYFQLHSHDGKLSSLAIFHCSTWICL